MIDKMIETIPSSLQLRIEAGKSYVYEAKYPWIKLKVGESFAIQDKSTVKLRSLKQMAWKTGKKLGFKLWVMEHDNCYEVGRIK